MVAQTALTIVNLGQKIPFEMTSAVMQTLLGSSAAIDSAESLNLTASFTNKIASL